MLYIIYKNSIEFVYVFNNNILIYKRNMKVHNIYYYNIIYNYIYIYNLLYQNIKEI